MQPSVAARCPNKFVAARISMLQSEAQVLQFQRQFYEAALAQLRATPAYGSQARLQQQQQQQEQQQQQQQTWHEAEQLRNDGGDEQQQHGAAAVNTERNDVEGAMQQLQQLPVSEDKCCSAENQVGRCCTCKLPMSSGPVRCILFV
jgi:hypothetical protein